MQRILLGFVAVLLSFTVQSAKGQGRKVISIDPGHGGEQAGVSQGDLLEKDITLKVAFILGEVLVDRGYDVHLVRTTDTTIGFNDRRAMAEAAGAVMMISLHVNGSDDESEHGAEIYANMDDPTSAAAASAVGDAIRETGAKVVVEGRPWEFLQSPTATTVMIEMAFMSHPVERRMILSPWYQHEYAGKIVDGVDRFLNRGQ
jgi:N-acetylmuramoyl-L-alanine amidase